MAWNSNDNGDEIVQNLINAFGNLSRSVTDVIQSQDFQKWLNDCFAKIREISDKLGTMDWEPLINALGEIGSAIGTVALDIITGLINVFKWFIEHPDIVVILLAIASAITILTEGLKIYTSITQIMNAVNAVTLGYILLIVAAIAAIIAIIALCIIHWDTIKAVVLNVWEVIKNAILEAVEVVIQYLTEIWNNVSFIFYAIWDVISTILGFVINLFTTVFQAIWNIVSPIISAIWTTISTIFQAIWNIISTILSSIWNIFSQIFNWIWQFTSTVFTAIWNIISPIINKIWETIKTILARIQEIWSTVWNIIAKVVNNIWNGIWTGIKGVINLILGGIENFVNGAIKGINLLLSGISSIANAIGGLIGIKPINLQINTISLPRLAKGNVAYSPMIAMFGEYAGASSNPEITTPQNIMAETFDEVLSNHEFSSRGNSPIQLAVYVGNKKLGDILLDNLRDIRRQTGSNLEAIVGG